MVQNIWHFVKLRGP